jgi:hypothetical protein
MLRLPQKTFQTQSGRSGVDVFASLISILMAIIVLSLLGCRGAVAEQKKESQEVSLSICALSHGPAAALSAAPCEFLR